MEGYEHNYHVFMYMLSTLEPRHSNMAVTPFFLCGITVYILYSTYTQPNCTLQAEGLSLSNPPALYFLYTLIHSASSNMLAVWVLGLVTLVLG